MMALAQIGSKAYNAKHKFLIAFLVESHGTDPGDFRFIQE